MKKTFSITDTARLIGNTTRTVQYWSGPECGLVPPTTGGAQGKAKRFDFESVVKLRVVHMLSELGVNHAVIRKIFRGQWMQHFRNVSTMQLRHGEELTISVHLDPIIRRLRARV